MDSTIISTSEARTKLYSLIEQVGNYGQSFTLTKGGRPMAILINPDELESIIETNLILQDKEMMVQLEESKKDVKNKRTSSLEELRGRLLSDS